MSKSLEELESELIKVPEGEDEAVERALASIKPFNLLKPLGEKCRHGVYNCNLPHNQEIPTDSLVWWDMI